ncbi:hypothetical protein SAMN04244559_02779 [Magnetospirillum fulvum]|uniref:Uncharacterized protein n=1 Tax=Magnetospirillum fulvum TaxID=1082 RepID=A0A1H6IYS1_MAGFU|nr:hypothetical protein SAMN04244559_02779 [Magnetospirillum fulvum]
MPTSPDVWPKNVSGYQDYGKGATPPSGGLWPTFNTSPIRVVTIDGGSWLVAKDGAYVMGEAIDSHPRTSLQISQ